MIDSWTLLRLPKSASVQLPSRRLTSGYIDISATDWMAAPAYEPHDGDIVALFVLGDGYDELKAVFDKLREGTHTDRFQDLHDMPFGTDGQFFDTDGYRWIVKGDKNA